MSVLFVKKSIKVGLGNGDYEVKTFNPFCSRIMSPQNDEIISERSFSPITHSYYLVRGKNSALLGFCTNNSRCVINGDVVFNLAKVQINEYAYLDKVKLDTKRKGIATMILSHKIIRLMEIYNHTFTITATIMDDAAKAWNNGEPHEDGNPPVYIYKKIFQHERPMKKTPDSDWTDERTFDLFNREADMKYYKELYKEYEQKVLKSLL